MEALLSALAKILEQGQGAVLVTVTASSGSTPRGAGARMLVTSRGLEAGTIGGGEIEYRCIEMAREILNTARPAGCSFTLRQGDPANLGMVCGGQVQVHFLPVAAGDASVRALCRDAEERFCSGEPFWLITPLEEGGALSLWPERLGNTNDQVPKELTENLSSEPACQTVGGHRWFTEQIQRPGAVYIFGGGHVSQALVPVLTSVNFPCVVLEDRADFVGKELFPLARESRVIDMNQILSQVKITKDDYVCIMTRGHENDLLVQQQVLHTPARYIGLIGSARKAAYSFAQLKNMGFSDADLSRIITPIGLPLGGRSPAEIAISIAAQLIQYRSGMVKEAKTYQSSDRS